MRAISKALVVLIVAGWLCTPGQAAVLRVPSEYATINGEQGITWSGIYGQWFCGARIRKVIVEENVIKHWNGAAIVLDQAGDVQFTCNMVDSCARAVEFSRNSNIENSGVRFRANSLGIGAYGQVGDQGVVRTDNALMLKLGPASSNKGSNILRADGEDWYAYENDPLASDSLNARENRWMRNGVVHTDSTTIRSYLTKDPNVTDAIRAYLGAPLEEVPDVCSGSGAAQGQRADLFEERTAEPTSAEPSGDLPLHTELRVVGVQGRGAQLRFELADPEPRHVVLEIFNVAGRRVRKLMEEILPGGRYGLNWNGDSDQKRRVAGGVYFIRLRAGDAVRVRKVVILN